MNLSDYAGTYHVKQGSSNDGRIRISDRIDITDGGTMTVTRTPSGEQCFQCDFNLDEELGCLRCDRWESAQPFVILISRYEESKGSDTYKAIYGTIIKKDPDSVGAWGADDNPGS